MCGAVVLILLLGEGGVGVSGYISFTVQDLNLRDRDCGGLRNRLPMQYHALSSLRGGSRGRLG